MKDTTTLHISGYQGQPVPNRFDRQSSTPRGLVIVFPGYGYDADMPVLYYPARIARNTGFDLLRVDYAYNRSPAWAQASEDEQLQWLCADSQSALQAALAQRDGYNEIVLVGKSLGTLALAHLLRQHAQLPPSRWVWLTPMLSSPLLREQILAFRPTSLFAIGRSDSFYNEPVLNELVNATWANAFVIPHANHSLEIPGDTGLTLHYLVQLMTAIQAFLLHANPAVRGVTGSLRDPS